jgi:hypothetical protein
LSRVLKGWFGGSYKSIRLWLVEAFHRWWWRGELVFRKFDAHKVSRVLEILRSWALDNAVDKVTGPGLA